MSFKTRSISVPTSGAISLRSVIDNPNGGNSGDIVGTLLLQAGEDNVSKVYFGDATEQPFYIKTETSAYIPERMDLEDFYITSTSGGNTVNVMVL